MILKYIMEKRFLVKLTLKKSQKDEIKFFPFKEKFYF